MKRLILAGIAALSVVGAGAIALNQSGDTVAHARQSAKSIVDAAKARGEVGEKINGYLEVVSGAPSDVQDAVREINIGRKSLYTRLAREQGVETEVVAQLVGEKQIANAASGSYVMRADGRWARK